MCLYIYLYIYTHTYTHTLTYNQVFKLSIIDIIGQWSLKKGSKWDESTVLVEWIEHFQATAWEGDHKQSLVVTLNWGDIAENSGRERQAKYAGKSNREKKTFQGKLQSFPHESSAEYLWAQGWETSHRERTGDRIPRVNTRLDTAHDPTVSGKLYNTWAWRVPRRVLIH